MSGTGSLSTLWFLSPWTLAMREYIHIHVVYVYHILDADSKYTSSVELCPTPPGYCYLISAVTVIKLPG